MAYSGFLSDPDYSRKSQDETITGKWVFKNEITKTSKNDRRCFGVISSEPGFVLNEKESDNHLPVALTGRVPCRVKGLVSKFDKLTTSKIPGVAKKKTLWDTICLKPTIGVALESKDKKTEKLIEIFVKAHI